MTGSAENRQVYTIPPGVSFVDALAAGILWRAGGEPLALSRMLVLVPTRRARISLRDAFLRASGGRPLLLPRISPIGDIEAEEAAGLADEEDPFLADGLGVPPAIPEARRVLLLARLVEAAGELIARRGARGGGKRGGKPFPADRAVRLARELARLLDRVQTERLSFDRLAGLVPREFAEHWQITLDFLEILVEHWPRILAEEGCVDPAERRNRVLAARAAAWRRRPPRDPVLAAGSTGSIPATADLLAAIAEIPGGALVLPGLDRRLDEESWQCLDWTHPQANLKRLLDRLGFSPADVRSWPWPGAPAEGGGREALVSEVMRPAETTHRWHASHPGEPSALEGLVRIDCAHPQEEAGVIALVLRETLEEEGKTGALVTFDRGLARRVAAELRRFRIEIDDSAGRPLSATPVGVFLRLIARFALERAAPVPLLALFKHPLACGGLAPAAFRSNVRRLERLLLRGPRPAPGFRGLRAGLRAVAKEGGARAEEVGDLITRLDELEEAAAPFLRGVARRKAPLRELVESHIRFAEHLAADAETDGALRLWSGEDGEAAAEFVTRVLRAADGFPRLDGAAYPAFLDALMEGTVVRPRRGGHPRLAIWGPLEARLQRADRMVLGGLNEGVWPPEVEADPWMSRPMRVLLGLPPPEQRIGLSAHDFAQAFAAPELVLTRSTRVEGAPTVPCRWLSRLDAVLAASGLKTRFDRGSRWLARWHRLDRAERPLPAGRPEPKPPLWARPRRLSVTEVERLMRDPYAVYARRILDLKALEPVDADPGAAERGILVHRVLDEFCRKHPKELPGDALARLVRIGERVFRSVRARPGAWAFWWPRFLRVAEWFVDLEERRRHDLLHVFSEKRGEIELAAPGGPFTLTAKADRIERRRDGTLAIVDYKTGAAPPEVDVQLGMSPQLPLEAAIAEAGGFRDVDPARVSEIAYFELRGGERERNRIKPLKVTDRLVAETLDGVRRLVCAFDDVNTPYHSHPRPGFAPRYSDYLHLARVKEWTAFEEETE